MKDGLKRWLAGALLYGLFSEWLRPFAMMAELTEVYRLAPLIGAAAVYMLIDMLPMRGFAAWPLKLFFTAAWIGFWFQPDALYSGAWWLHFPELLAEDAMAVRSGELTVRAESRTLLFLAGWAAVIYAAQRLIIERGQALWFVSATAVFLSLLQLWPGINTAPGLMRAAAYGMALLALLQGPKWEKLLKGAFGESRSAARSRLLTSLGCAAAIYALSYWMAAEAPAQAEPGRFADWLRTAAERHGAAAAAWSPAGYAVTGYGWDDSRLGEAVRENFAAAFVAVTERPTYWRGESKDVYDGRGWRSGKAGAAAEAGAADESKAAERIEQRVEIKAPELSRIVFAGGRIVRVPEMTDKNGARVSDIHLRRDEASGKYEIATRGIRLGSYRIVAELPALSPEALLADKAPEPASEQYLQLPDDLPERVRELARKITDGVPHHPYLLASAVQAYLHEHYRYTLNTSPPPEGQDFADHFLFESKAGYCNHFSTAMVVLLRSLGVEARWVKGFAPGVPDPERPNTYVVRHADAHSWVEVRFEHAGWVPFEATPPVFFASADSGGAPGGTFAAGAGRDALWAAPANMLLPAGYELSARLKAAEAATAPAAEERAPASLAGRPAAKLGEAAAYAAALAAEAVSGAVRLLRNADWAGWAAWGLPAAAAAAFGLAAAAAAAQRGRRSPAAGLCPIRRRRLRRLDAMWRRLYRRRGKPLAHETLREYAARLAADAPAAVQEALAEWVRRDEAVRYGTARGISRRRLAELWRKISLLWHN